MKNLLELLRRRKSNDAIENDVVEELRFHIDMQAYDYESSGVSAKQSRQMAEKRFGNVQKIKTECVRISKGTTVITWMLTSVFLMSLVVGLFLSLVIPGSNVGRVGDLMMMIGGLGILLVYAKRAGAMVFTSKSKSLGLGLDNSPPLSFDEQGRTPFDRVRESD